MAENVTPRVRAHRKASDSIVVSVRTLFSPPMESGMRRDSDSKTIPRSIINRFVCTFNGETVVDVTMEPSIATNPYFQFEAKVMESGTFNFTWYDDDGSVYEDSSDITVS